MDDVHRIALAQAIERFNAKLTAQRVAESLAGRHYTAYVGEIRDLMRAGNLARAEFILLAVCDVMERSERFGVAPWYYERLAIIYRKQKRRDDEIAVLERYFRQKRAGGARVAKLTARLERLKQ